MMTNQNAPFIALAQSSYYTHGYTAIIFPSLNIQPLTQVLHNLCTRCKLIPTLKTPCVELVTTIQDLSSAGRLIAFSTSAAPVGTGTTQLRACVITVHSLAPASQPPRPLE